jgi:C4-type Zn-finger protein
MLEKIYCPNCYDEVEADETFFLLEHGGKVVLELLQCYSCHNTYVRNIKFEEE